MSFGVHTYFNVLTKILKHIYSTFLHKGYSTIYNSQFYILFDKVTLLLLKFDLNDVMLQFIIKLSANWRLSLFSFLANVNFTRIGTWRVLILDNSLSILFSLFLNP